MGEQGIVKTDFVAVKLDQLLELAWHFPFSVLTSGAGNRFD
jgi:hypothetical protein